MTKVLFLVLGMFLLAPSCRAQTHWGIQAGGLLSNTTGISSGSPDNLLSRKKNLLGSPQGGLWGDLRMSDYVDFQPHLLFIQKGAALPNTGETGGAGHLQLNYLELPLNLMYRIPFEYDDLFIGGGVYGACGLGGHYTAQSDSSGGTAYSGPVLFNDRTSSSQDLHLHPFDAGYQAEISYQCSFGLTFSLHYSRGLTNISTEGSGRVLNQYAGLSVGYLFHYNTKD